MRHILIVAPNWIGDAVMSEPLVRALQQTQAKISVLAPPWVAAVYRAMASVDDVIEGDFKHGRVELFKRIALARNLQQKGFTDALILPNSWKSALIPTFAQIPHRFAYTGELRSFLLTQSLANPPRQNRPPMVAHYLALAKLIDPQIVINGAQMQEPRLQPPPAPGHLAIDTAQPFFVFAPGAEFGPSKQWPAGHFAQLASYILQNDPQPSIVLMGSQKDIPIAEEIMRQTVCENPSRLINVCGQTPLADSIAILKHAKGLVSNDSGMMHIGAALQIPQIAFFGSSDPSYTPPLSSFAGIMYLNLACSPCHQRICPLGHLNCLNQISPQSAFDELHRVMNLLKAV